MRRKAVSACHLDLFKLDSDIQSRRCRYIKEPARRTRLFTGRREFLGLEGPGQGWGLHCVRHMLRTSIWFALPFTFRLRYPDKTRGLFNEGGLFGERRGWHLPGFDTSAWDVRELSDGLPGGGAGVGFFVTTFELDLDDFLDVHMSFTFEDPLGMPYRALLFVNGWMMGKRVANLGCVFV